jgi:hypothetical protein
MEWMERTTNSFLFLLLLLSLSLLVLLYVCVTTMAGYQLGSYLESYIESVSTLPAELKRNFTLIRELDARSKGWPSRYHHNCSLLVQQDLEDEQCLVVDAAALVDLIAIVRSMMQKHKTRSSGIHASTCHECDDKANPKPLPRQMMLSWHPYAKTMLHVWSTLMRKSGWQCRPTRWSTNTFANSIKT